MRRGRRPPRRPRLHGKRFAPISSISHYDNEIVARVLLIAKYLFDERNATVKPFVASLFESCLMLTRQLLELDSMTHELADEIRRKESTFAEKAAAPNGFNLPSVPGIDTKRHSILSTADKARDTVLAICRLQFLPGAGRKAKLEELDKSVATAMQSEPELVTAWKECAKFFSLIRNMRNASEHRKEGYQVVLTNFSMRPDGLVYPPLFEIQHPDTPIRTLPVVELLELCATRS